MSKAWPGWWLGWLLLFSGASAAIELPRPALVPGGVAIVALPADGEQPPRAWYRDRRVMVVRQGEGWYAVVGIPLSAKPGRHTVTVKGARRDHVSFTVKEKKYREQHLTIKNRRMVNPNATGRRRVHPAGGRAAEQPVRVAPFLQRGAAQAPQRAGYRRLNGDPRPGPRPRCRGGHRELFFQRKHRFY